MSAASPLSGFAPPLRALLEPLRAREVDNPLRDPACEGCALFGCCAWHGTGGGPSKSAEARRGKR